MLRTLIIGFGRAGQGLHAHVLHKIPHGGILSSAPPLVWDIRDVRPQASAEGLLAIESLAQARDLTDPESTVVHVCTPPTSRLEVLRELAELGFRMLLVEKPLATDMYMLEQIEELRRTYRLRLMVVAHWLDSELTRRMTLLTRQAEHGVPESLSILQHKSRLRRTLESSGHPTAFDVEFPHSVGVALRLAGDAEVRLATATDMMLGDQVRPWMGAARVILEHHGGTTTEIFSNLMSPVRERRISADLGGRSVTGYYPVGGDDHYAQLDVTDRTGRTHEIFADDSLTRFMVRAYRQFHIGTELDQEFELNVRVCRVLSDAKEMCRATSEPAAAGAAADIVALAGGAVDHVG